MDFLLECVGFPPDRDERELVELVRRVGEPAAWRGRDGEHLSLRLAEGLELRFDREEEDGAWSLLPFFRENHRLRVAVESIGFVADSPFDAILVGWAAPPTPGAGAGGARPGEYLLTTWLTDARRLPRDIARGHVLAVSTAGFALDVQRVGPNLELADAADLERPRGARIEPLRAADAPEGCAEVSARVRELRHVRNAITGVPIDVLEVDAPGRPLHLFVSPWQLARDGLPAPRPGWRVEGTFLFLGRIAGGLPGPSRRARRAFG